MRATWITDIHLDAIAYPMPFIDKIAEEKPDVVFVTGDTSKANRVHADLHGIRELVGVPVYYVLGNHDFYGSSILAVREEARAKTQHTENLRVFFERVNNPAPVWIPSVDPVRLTDHVVLTGVDGWGDARCGNLESRVKLNDWRLIEDFSDPFDPKCPRIEFLRALGEAEAMLLAMRLSRVKKAEELIVLTHVPPFPEACIYQGQMSEPDFLPWFTCVQTGEVLDSYARYNPEIRITVLCGHSHGKGTYQHLPNLTVRTGGWDPGEREYGNPIIQDTLVLR